MPPDDQVLPPSEVMLTRGLPPTPPSVVSRLEVPTINVVCYDERNGFIQSSSIDTNSRHQLSRFSICTNIVIDVEESPPCHLWNIGDM